MPLFYVLFTITYLRVFLSMWSLFRFRSCFNFFNRQPAVRNNVLKTSARVHPVAVKDHVFLVGNLQYRVNKVWPESDTVCLQKITTRDRPFKRFIRRQIWLPPPPTADSSDSVDLPSSNCFCPEPLPPPVLRAVEDISKQADAEIMDVSVQADQPLRTHGLILQLTFRQLTNLRPPSRKPAVRPQSTTICTPNLTNP